MVHRKLRAMYNYSLGVKLAARRGETPYEHPKPFDRVLALDPAIDLSRLRGWGELASIMTGLIQLAKLSKRVLVIPQIPCETQFIHEPRTLKQYSRGCTAPSFWKHDASDYWPIFYPIDKDSGELVGGWVRSRKLLGGDANAQGTNLMEPAAQQWWAEQRYMAALPGLLDKHCMAGINAIIYPDLYHWLSNTEAGTKGERQPLSKSSAFRVAAGESGLLIDPPAGVINASGIGGTVDPIPSIGWSWYDRQAVVPVIDALREMHRLIDEPIVWLSHPIMIVPGNKMNGEQLPPENELNMTLHMNVSAGQGSGQGQGSRRIAWDPWARLEKINLRINSSEPLIHV